MNASTSAPQRLCLNVAVGEAGSALTRLEGVSCGSFSFSRSSLRPPPRRCSGASLLVFGHDCVRGQAGGALRLRHRRRRASVSERHRESAGQRIGVQASYAAADAAGTGRHRRIRQLVSELSVGRGSLLDARTARSVALAAGGGVLHEPDGVNVLLPRRRRPKHRILALRRKHAVSEAEVRSRIATRVDLITSVGWRRNCRAACRSVSKR